MATAQLLHPKKKQKTSKAMIIFPDKIASEQDSMVLVKRLFAISISCITYLRGLFPESSYGTHYLDELCLKILREDKKCPGSLHIVKWIQGSFDALEKKYLRMAMLVFYTNPKDPESVTELYQFKFRYTKEGPQMDLRSDGMHFESNTSCDEVKNASTLLIRKLYMVMQNLGPLPNDVTLTMKLFYYNEVTPNDYQPSGFKEGSSSDMMFEGDPVNLKVGSVSTGFHTMKVKVTTESDRAMAMDSKLVQENSMEISHEGLDCEEEEEEEDAKGQLEASTLPDNVQNSQANDGDINKTYIKKKAPSIPAARGIKEEMSLRASAGRPSTKKLQKVPKDQNAGVGVCAFPIAWMLQLRWVSTLTSGGSPFWNLLHSSLGAIK